MFDNSTELELGAKERRERIKQTTRQGILDGARQIAQEDGWSALTIRKVADYIEYSPSIVYEYFASKDDILHALLRDGFRELALRMERARQSTDDPMQQAVRISEAYWQFAYDHPDLYQLMHGLAGVPTDSAIRAEAIQAVCAIAESTLLGWAEANDVHLSDPLASTEIVWSLLHGWVSLTVIDRVYRDQDRARRLLIDAVQALLQGWKVTGRGT